MSQAPKDNSEHIWIEKQEPRKPSLPKKPEPKPKEDKQVPRKPTPPVKPSDGKRG